MRELTLTAVYHPEHIEGWQLVDHPTVRPLANGEPTLGWEGDPRLAVYLHGESKTFVVWRLEHDGQYRPVARMPGGAVLTPQAVNGLIRNLIRIDARRGFDPGEDVERENATKAVELESAYRENLAQAADRLQYGMKHSYLPGTD